VVIAELRPLTRDDLLAMPDDGNRYEIINGELIVTPAPLARHQRVLLRLTLLLHSYLAEHGGGELFIAPLDIVLGPNDVVEPDLLIIASEQGRVRGTENFFDGPPVLVIEIISPSSQRTDLVKKMALYARSGVPEYWTVDPQRQELTIRVLTTGTYVSAVHDAEGWIASEALAGLRISPSEIFADLD
jgi:Uma2 family endonuclease